MLVCYYMQKFLFYVFNKYNHYHDNYGKGIFIFGTIWSNHLNSESLIYYTTFDAIRIEQPILEDHV